MAVPGLDDGGSLVPRVVCAWCGKVMRDAPGESALVSHGICAGCLGDSGLVPVESLHSVNQATADQLPFGYLRLDGEGTVRGFNRVESSRSGMSSQEVLGRDFFSEVAPCTRVREFEGRFREMVEAGAAARESFRFVFRLPGSVRLVYISLAYHPQVGATILVEDQGP